MRFLSSVFLGVVLLSACTASAPDELKIEKPFDDHSCPEIYQPVCGKVQVQCITTPCDPVQQTFDNDCFAEQGKAFDIVSGECDEGGGGLEGLESLNTSTALSTGVEMVDYGGAVGYLAVPAGEGSFPALILIHEWWGLNDNIKWYADQFAQKGYIALAVDLYDGEATENRTRAGELAGRVRDDMEGAFANLESAVAFLKNRPDVLQESMASVGWCFGGGWSYQMAKNDLGVAASVIYYGQFNPDDDLAIMRANIMGHFGEDDKGIPVDDVKAFRAALQTQGGEHQIFIYENEGHGFAHELESESAKKAWTRTLDFLDEQL